MDITLVITAIGTLTIITNIVTEVIKKLTGNKISASLLAIIVSMVATITTGIAYMQINHIPATWYMIIGIIFCGFGVAYAAMFGFDKLKEMLGKGANNNDT